MQAKTWEVVLYEDGTSALTEYDRGETGQLTYIGREFFDGDETAELLRRIRDRPFVRDAALARAHDALRKVQQWERDLKPEDGIRYGSYWPAFAVNAALGGNDEH